MFTQSLVNRNTDFFAIMRMQSQWFAGYSLIWWHLLFNERLRHQGKTSLALASSEIWREYPFHLHIPHQCCFISVLAPIKFLWWSQKWGPSKWTTFRLLYIAWEGWIVWAISNVERRPRTLTETWPAGPDPWFGFDTSVYVRSGRTLGLDHVQGGLSSET